MTEFIQVTTTAENEDRAKRIARALVDAKLAACVQVYGPIQSTYRWNSVVETAREWQCVAKSRVDLFSEVAQCIREHHDYDVPEILAVPIVAGSGSYLAWLAAELRPGSTAQEP